VNREKPHLALGFANRASRLNVGRTYTGFMQTSWAYLNGRWIPSAELSIAVDDAGFLLGATVTERLRTFRRRVFRLEEHLARLRHSLEIVGLDPPQITAEIREVVAEFIRRNRGLIAADDDWSILAFATPGVAGSGRPTVCVHGYPLPFQLWASRYETGTKVVISDVRQIPPECLPPELKCRSRMHFYLADRRAAARQPDARAILLDEDGYIAEATTANVLVYRAQEGLVSPPKEHILFGVSMGVVQELAATLKVPFVTRRLSVDEFRSADEAMLASTSSCLLPIVECDGQSIGDGKPGQVHKKLLAAWSELVAVDIAAQARQFASRSN
jgi:branched-subunit amino acid aminotransferase/4-amino-4-deoxychorismate lyase